jgi:hypothetical protein
MFNAERANVEETNFESDKAEMVNLSFFDVFTRKSKS